MRLLLAVVTGLTLLAPRSAPAQSAALHTLFHDIFDDQLKRWPEFASAIGDMRYNDQLADLSARAFNDGIAAEQGFLNRILIIDTSGLSDDDKQSADLVQRELTADLESSSSKPWELPITPGHAIQADLAALATNTSFNSVKDYDDYILRLHLIPRQLRQASENLLAGIDENRVEPASVIEDALKQTEGIAAQTPEASPFAAPLHHFAAAIPAASEKRITAELLDTIQTDVLPAYARFAKFLRVTELPAAQRDHAVIAASAAAGLGSVRSTILGLRARSATALGAKFDLRGFHDLIAAAWQLPPETLSGRVDTWIATSK